MATKNEINSFNKSIGNFYAARFIKNKLCWILLFCLSNQQSQAQERTAIQTFGIQDTASIIELINKGTQLSEKLPKEALQYLTSALENSKAIQYPKGIALASAGLGRWYFGSDMGKSIELGNEALRSFEKNQWGTIDNIADVHLLLAEAYDEQGQKDSSAYYYYILGEEMDAGNITNPEFAVMVFTKLTIFWVNLDYGGVVNEEYKKNKELKPQPKEKKDD